MRAAYAQFSQNEIIKLLFMQSSPASCNFQIFSPSPCSQTHPICMFPLEGETTFHTHKRL